MAKKRIKIVLRNRDENDSQEIILKVNESVNEVLIDLTKDEDESSLPKKIDDEVSQEILNEANETLDKIAESKSRVDSKSEDELTNSNKQFKKDLSKAGIIAIINAGIKIAGEIISKNLLGG